MKKILLAWMVISISGLSSAGIAAPIQTSMITCPELPANTAFKDMKLKAKLGTYKPNLILAVNVGQAISPESPTNASDITMIVNNPKDLVTYAYCHYELPTLHVNFLVKFPENKKFKLSDSYPIVHQQKSEYAPELYIQTIKGNTANIIRVPKSATIAQPQ